MNIDVPSAASMYGCAISQWPWKPRISNGNKAGGPDVETNGLALCALHQRLFDRGAFTLSKQLQIMVSDEANGSAGFQEWLMRYHGQVLQFPQRKSYYPDEKYTSWHVKEVFQGAFRELKSAFALLQLS